MHFELTPEQRALKDAAARMAERQLEPLLRAHDARSALPKSAFLSVLQVLAEHRLTAARLPAEAGGPGITPLEYGLMFEQLPAPIAMALMAHEVSVARLHLEAPAALKARLLPDLIAGRRIACTASTEPDMGSDVNAVKARLVDENGTLKLYGRKMWITNISVCDVAIVTCVDARRSEERRRVIKVVVERSATSFETREIDTIGLDQGYLGEAVFDGCVVPAGNVIDTDSAGTAVLKATWLINRPLVGLIEVHLAQAAFDIALEHARMRSAFGKPIGAHQLVQKNLSDMATAIEASRLLCYRALDAASSGAASEGLSAMAKRYAQNACEEAIRQAMNLLGAMGLSREAGLERIYRDARMLNIPDGTNEILALIHGRELTGVAAFR